MISGGSAARGARRRLPAPLAELIEDISDRLPCTYQLDHLLGIDGATQNHALGLRVTNPGKASMAILFWLNSDKARPLMWIADMMALETDKGDGSNLMLAVTDAVIPVMQPRVIALNAQGDGRHYWPRHFQTMAPRQRAEWHSTHCLPFANAYRSAISADDYELLSDPKTSLSVLAALDAPDPRASCGDEERTLGRALFKSGPDFTCYTAVTPGIVNGMRILSQARLRRAQRKAETVNTPATTSLIL